MRAISNHYRLCLSIVALLMLTLACGLLSSGNPEAAAKTAFEKWAQQVGVPYKNISYQTTQNDGTFATVRVQATLKESKMEDWLEKQADVECRHVGSEWQCNSTFVFALTEAERARQAQITSGTATAAAINLQATATEQSRQAEATRQALMATQAVVRQNANATATANALAVEATRQAIVATQVVVKQNADATATAITLDATATALARPTVSPLQYASDDCSKPPGTTTCCCFVKYHIHDLGQVFPAGTRIRIQWQAGTPGGTCPGDTAVFSVSTSNIAWDEIGRATVAPRQEVGDTIHREELVSLVAFRYVKVEIPKCYNDYSSAEVNWKQ
jgi:hypothetical protein